MSMTFNAFVQNISQNTLPFDIYDVGHSLPAESYLNWIYRNPEHLSTYSLDDFLEMYMECYDIFENYNLAEFDEALAENAGEMEQHDMEKWLDFSDLKKDIETFGYSNEMDTMEYDAW